MNEFQTTKDLIVRDLDGIYLRARIDGHWQNRCLTDLVWNDVEAWINEKWSDCDPILRADFILKIAKHLHERLRAVGDVTDIIVKFAPDLKCPDCGADIVKFAPDLKCPDCGADNMKTEMHMDKFQYGYGEKAVMLEAEIPFRICEICGF